MKTDMVYPAEKKEEEKSEIRSVQSGDWSYDKAPGMLVETHLALGKEG